MPAELPPWAAAAFAVPDSYVRLSCGCETWNQMYQGNKFFMMRPCSLTCENYRYAVDESRRQGVALEYRKEI